MEKTIITKLLLIKDRGTIMAHLESPIWEFEKFGNVIITSKSDSIYLKYVGFGNISDTAVLMLKTNEFTIFSMEQIEEIISKSDEYWEIIRDN